MALGLLLLGALPACEQSKTGDAATAPPRNEADLPADDLISNPNTANPQAVAVPTDLGVMTFSEKEFAFGDIKQGDVVKHTFTFTNTGKKPIIIENASSSCGCTVPTYPREPVAPGAKGQIDVQFNSAGKHDQVVKVVSIRANTVPNINEVTIKANVLTP
ncbi:MAG: DUF1573 domain-containing protein [Hymenobacteraceae bacterium]|nr:DUF1573 domain-containing protein [Hymenobacteraceae bacterium]